MQYIPDIFGNYIWKQYLRDFIVVIFESSISATRFIYIPYISKKYIYANVATDEVKDRNEM